ncbi:unnamed protein product [Strongylus vulgaris]|uniref:Neurotransmitter-gated ion-channel transmembrane domain-containing protein n=1 Tax=Strongylus vulgaris TaxID=40348 RepID=A0A3P7J2P2_STRVU|nr:unnamed protein product [Strongylus vulgaris]
MQRGMDLSFFYRSAEWDLLSLSSQRHSVLYASCCGPEKYVDITYYFGLRVFYYFVATIERGPVVKFACVYLHRFKRIKPDIELFTLRDFCCYGRRKTLFFTCNLIIPCFLISILTTFVFYLSDHKITFSISILVTLTVFFLVLIDLMPPTSLVIPMFGRYLITTMILVALSTVVSVVTVNFRFRSGSAHKMSPWIRAVFLNFLPRVLFMSRPLKKDQSKPSPTLVDPTSLVERPLKDESKVPSSTQPNAARLKLPAYPGYLREKTTCQDVLNNAFGVKGEQKSTRIATPMKPLNAGSSNNSAPRVVFRKTKKAKGRVDDVIFINLLQQVRFIAEHFQHNERESEISDDWTFVAMVLDRLFLLIFSVLNVGTMFIILEAPSLYDYSEAMNITVPSKPLGQANLFGSHSRSM